MSMPGSSMTSVGLPLPLRAAGKVREMYELGDSKLLMVATDRISAYDVVMKQGIPGKGSVLTGMSVFWFDKFRDVCPNHLVSTSPADLPDSIDDGRDQLAGRFMIVKELEMLQVEFVIRGYLVGSGWKDYRQSGAICGIALPEGLREADKLPEPVFTPATKATSGHDENISEQVAREIVGGERLDKARDYSLELYRRASEYAATRGIILADTKFEFGVDAGGEVVIADEVLTPDSSRFWPADQYAPGATPPSFDKQFLRDWLDAQQWNRRPPPPDLPDEVIAQTRSKYAEAYEKLTGESLERYLTS